PRRSSDLIPDKCTSCSGKGRVKKNVNIQVSIPAGIAAGQQIRVTGKGEPGKNGGTPGDIFVVSVIQPHEYFNREGDHIFLELPITFAQAALGDEISVPTVPGKVMTKKHAGTQVGKTVRLRGKGAPNVRGQGHGDQHVKVRVVTPTKLTDEQKELLKQFNQSTDNEPITEGDESFFSKFKKAFKGD